MLCCIHRFSFDYLNGVLVRLSALGQEPPARTTATFRNNNQMLKWRFFCDAEFSLKI